MLGKTADDLVHDGDEYPMPKVHAVYDTSGRNLPGAVTLQDKNDVITHLRTTQHYPLFIKPSRSAYGWKQ